MLSEIIYALAALVSASAAVLAWVAKIRWANEYKEAKEAQIQQWKDMASTTLLPEFKATKEMWEDISRAKDEQIAKLKADQTPPLAQGVEIVADDRIAAMQDQLVSSSQFSKNTLKICVAYRQQDCDQ